VIAGTVAAMAVMVALSAVVSTIGGVVPRRCPSRPRCWGSAPVAITSCLTGAISGDIGQDHSDRWPVVVMLVVSMVAIILARHGRPSA
jgi:hypothetical protein